MGHLGYGSLRPACNTAGRWVQKSRSQRSRKSTHALLEKTAKLGLQPSARSEERVHCTRAG